MLIFYTNSAKIQLHKWNLRLDCRDWDPICCLWRVICREHKHSNAVHSLGGEKTKQPSKFSQNIVLFWLRYVYSALCLRSVLLNVMWNSYKSEWTNNVVLLQSKMDVSLIVWHARIYSIKSWKDEAKAIKTIISNALCSWVIKIVLNITPS